MRILHRLGSANVVKRITRIEFEEDVIHEDVNGDANRVDDANGDDDDDDDDDDAIDDAYGDANADDAYDDDSAEFGWFDTQYYSQYFFSHAKPYSATNHGFLIESR